jgi:hypothetical protein
VTICDDVVLFVSLGGDVLHGLFLVECVVGTYLMLDGVNTFLISPFRLALMCCGSALCLGEISLGDTN